MEAKDLSKINSLIEEARRLQVLAFIRSKPEGVTIQDIVAAIGIPEQTARRHANSLLSTGGIVKVGKYPVRYKKADQLEEVLAIIDKWEAEDVVVRPARVCPKCGGVFSQPHVMGNGRSKSIYQCLRCLRYFSS